MAQLTTAAVKTADVEDQVDRKLEITFLRPIVYTGSGGGGENEYAASPNAHKPNAYEIHIPEVRGGQIFAAFWEPLDNIPALPSFTYIEVVPAPQDHGDHIKLSLAGRAQDNARLRLMIKILYWAK